MHSFQRKTCHPNSAASRSERMANVNNQLILPVMALMVRGKQDNPIPMNGFTISDRRYVHNRFLSEVPLVGAVVGGFLAEGRGEISILNEMAGVPLTVTWNVANLSVASEIQNQNAMALKVV